MMSWLRLSISCFDWCRQIEVDWGALILEISTGLIMLNAPTTKSATWNVRWCWMYDEQCNSWCMRNVYSVCSQSTYPHYLMHSHLVRENPLPNLYVGPLLKRTILCIGEYWFLLLKTLLLLVALHRWLLNRSWVVLIGLVRHVVYVAILLFLPHLSSNNHHSKSLHLERINLVTEEYLSLKGTVQWNIT